MYVSSNQILVRLFERQGETFIRTNWKIKKRKPHFEYNIFFNLFDNRRDVDLICVLDVFLWWTPLSDESDKCALIKRIQWKKQRMWKRRAAVGDFWIYSKEKQLRGYFKSMLLTLSSRSQNMIHQMFLVAHNCSKRITWWWNMPRLNQWRICRK